VLVTFKIVLGPNAPGGCLADSPRFFHQKMAYMLLHWDSNFNGSARFEIFMVRQQVMRPFLVGVRMGYSSEYEIPI
jgi:hypothetical protein